MTGRSIEDFVQSEFAELTGVGDCYGDETRIFFAFTPELFNNDGVGPGYIFVSDPVFGEDGVLNDWAYCLRISTNSLDDLFARMHRAVRDKHIESSSEERADPGPMVPTEPFTNKIEDYEVDEDNPLSAGMPSGGIDAEENGVIQE